MKPTVEFNAKLATFIMSVQKNQNEYYTSNYKTINPPVIYVDYGSRYVKVVSDNGTQTSVFCFIDIKNGDVLKAASWKQPAKHARGNIFKDDNGLSGVTIYGGVYLR